MGILLTEHYIPVTAVGHLFVLGKASVGLCFSLRLNVKFLNYLAISVLSHYTSFG